MSREDDIAREAERAQQLLKPSELNTPRIVKDICATAPIPAGWIQVDDYWNPTICGSPTMIYSNVFTIEYHVDKPIGSVLNTCVSSLTPVGWVNIGEYWDPNHCGRPSFIVNNRKQIEKVGEAGTIVTKVGYVTKIPADYASQCQDGAKYFIQLSDGTQGRLRAIPKSSAEADLVRLVTTGIRLSIQGYSAAGLSGPQCDRFDAFSVQPT